MPLWSDNFNRADGPLGTDWTVIGGAASIATNAVTFTGTTEAAAGPVTGPGSAMAECDVQLASALYNGCGPAVKMNSSDGRCYWAHAYISGSDTVYIIFAYTIGTQFNVASYTQVGSAPSSVRLRLTYNAGTLTLYSDGVQKCQGSNTTFAAHTRVGIFSTGTNNGADDFDCSGDGQADLFVTPKVIGTDDGDMPMTLMATAVTWTPGTPGSPTFTVNAGAISGQVIDSTSNARAIFSPPTTPQVVTVSDTTNGISDTITVVEGTYLGGGTGGMGGLTEAAVAWIEAQAAHGGLVLSDVDETDGTVSGILIKGALGELLLGTKTTATPPAGYLNTADVVSTIWHILNGGVEHTSESDVFQTVLDNKQAITDLAASFGAFRDPPTYTIQDILDNLRGTGDYNHTDLKTAIDAITGGDNSDVLAALETLRGDESATLAGIVALVQGISTIAGYDLSDVQQWIESARGTNLPTIRSVLDALSTHDGALTTHISNVRNDIAAAALVITAIQVGLGTVSTTVSGIAETATDILDIVTDLQSATPDVGPPVWPGLDGVTLGTEVPLSDGLVIAGPMHGVVLAITGAAPRAQHYDFADVTSWSRAGALIFGTDRGDYERSQSFSLDTQVLTPQTMRDAAEVIVRLNAGWTGTIRPWTITA